MHHRITLLTLNKKRDDSGEFLPPTDFSDCWADISLLQGKELDKAQQIIAEVTHKVVVSYQPGIESQMLVQFEDRVFTIQAVQDPDERHVELHLLCVERNEGLPGEQ